MIITKVRDDIVKNRADEQRQVAKETIRDCFDMGEGIYQVEDDRKIYPSKDRMIMRLKTAASHHKRKNPDLVIRVATKNKKEKVFVIVENIKGGAK